MSSLSLRGYGRELGMIGATSDLIPRTDLFPAGYAEPIITDWTFPPGPPAPAKIPYAWLSPGLKYRPDDPITTSAVTVAGKGTFTDRDDNALAEYGDKPFGADLSTVDTQDAVNLNEFVLTYWAQPGDTPRARIVQLELQLIGRSEAEKQLILGVGQGRRIHITDTPPSWPAGMAHQIVEGISREYSDGAIVRWKTSPVIGADPGVAGPWFRLDTSLTTGDHVMPY